MIHTEKFVQFFFVFERIVLFFLTSLLGSLESNPAKSIQENVISKCLGKLYKLIRKKIDVYPP